MMRMLGNKLQGSDSKISHTNMWGPLEKIVLALLLAKLAQRVVTGEEARIIQGAIPPPGKYPAIGRLTSTTKNCTTASCVLSILNRDWLVAPATCFFAEFGDGKFDNIRIVVGDEIVNETEPYEQVLKIERFIVHHRHDPVRASSNKQLGDDIAVVKVTPPIKFSNRVTATNLPTCKEFEPGIGMVVGYGSGAGEANQFLEVNHRLKEITNKIISHEECRKILKNIPIPLDDRNFCVQAVNNMSTCFLDWGAPFYRVKSDNHMVLHGFMSRYPSNGYFCGVDANIAIFTRVSSYVGWIHRRISGCGNHPWINQTGPSFG